MKHVLTIAGSDSSGGAGIQADLKAFSAWGVYGLSVLTAVTAQNTVGVQAIRVLDPEIVEAQLESVFSDIKIDAVKLGMLANAELIAVVARVLAKYRPAILVLDPVMVAKSGHHLLDPTAETALARDLIPLATVVTPNLPEVAALLGFLPVTVNDMIQAGERLVALGAQAALIKGGHRAGDATDVLVTATGMARYSRERLPGRHTHGTGCSLSSALAALLARQVPLYEAVAKAKAYVAEGIAHGLAVGHGCGPIHHFVRLYGGLESPL